MFARIYSAYLREGFTVLSVTLMTPAKDPTTPNSVTPVCTLALPHYPQMSYCDTRCRKWGGRTPSSFFCFFFLSFLYNLSLFFIVCCHSKTLSLTAKEKIELDKKILKNFLYFLRAECHSKTPSATWNENTKSD